VPARNPYFTGRESLLDGVQQALIKRKRAALSGLGGAGKTQTAIEYAHRHQGEYTHLFWAAAASQEVLISSYVALAGLLNLPEHTAKDQTLALEAIKRWLSQERDWLLILDNADDIGMVRPFIPSDRGHVILTTRARAMGGLAQKVEVGKMDAGEGALLLLRRAGMIAEDAPLSAASEADRAAAQEISEKLLDGLPLALDQAGAYLEETGCGLQKYRDLYQKQGPELLKKRGNFDFSHPDPVATTWALSFENIEKANPAAADLLRICAFLDSDGIPEELFAAGAAELGPVLGPVASDELALEEAISEILKYSLINRDSSTKSLEIHRLVQTVLRQPMDEATQRLWAERTVRAVYRALPQIEFSAWPVYERFLPQANACVQLINEWELQFPEAGRLITDVGFYLSERARYRETEPLYQRALAIREQALGPAHPDVATSLNNLAEIYRVQGEYTKAESLHQRALTIREQVLEPDHPDVATSLNNLAGLYHGQGQYAQAEPLYKQALTILQNALGPEHPNTITCMESYAYLLEATDRTEQADQLRRRAAAIRAKLASGSKQGEP
jgi:tetratricopeptide (TPR) repeat protein